MATATVGGQSVSYAYAGDGLRASRTHGGITTNLLWDQAGGLPLLVGDGTADYVQADGMLMEEVGAASTSYPLTDGLRSTRATTDAAGAVTGTVDWDVWGNLQASSGTQGALGWTGELADAATGLTYLRARDYSPGEGRFVQRDPALPNAPGVQGYNPYWYANDDPVTRTDPTGTRSAYCGICTPMSMSVVLAFEARRALVAAEAPTDLSSGLGGQKKWVLLALGLVAALFTCILLPQCHTGDTEIDGAVDTDAEEAARQAADAASTALLILEIEAALRAARVPKVDPTPTPDPATDPTTVPPPGPKEEPTAKPCKINEPFTHNNFRKNLICLTHTNPGDGFQAHHVFPQKFKETYFDDIFGFNQIHNPIYGQWWEKGDHQHNKDRYNRIWEAYLAVFRLRPPTIAETEEEGREIMAQFGLTTLYP